MRRIPQQTLNSRKSSDFTQAWMVDKDGIAIEIEAHVQAGEEAISQLDEYAICVLDEYIQKTGDERLDNALKQIIEEQVIGDIYACYQEDDEVEPELQGDNEYEIDLYKWVVTGKLLESKQAEDIYMKYLQQFGRSVDLNTLLEYYENNVEGDDGIKYAHMLFDRYFMRVRAGGLKNHTVKGNHEIYFRIPDTKPEAWYRAISNFMWDHPEYAGYKLNIYAELNAANPKFIEDYESGKEYLDLHSSRKMRTNRQILKLNSFYRREYFRKYKKFPK